MAKDKTDQQKAEELKKKKEEQSGIPIDNEHVSSDPNRSPQGSDQDAHINREADHIEPYNKKVYHPDPKQNK